MGVGDQVKDGYIKRYFREKDQSFNEPGIIEV